MLGGAYAGVPLYRMFCAVSHIWIANHVDRVDDGFFYISLASVYELIF